MWRGWYIEAGWPSLGAWSSYGLGTENSDKPTDRPKAGLLPAATPYPALFPSEAFPSQRALTASNNSRHLSYVWWLTLIGT